jgi:RNA polymerase sigma factor (TIGR02999 family)
MLASVSDVTRLLNAATAGDPCAAEQLLPLVYVELRNLAAARMAEEKPGQTLQPTALVHEAYLRLVGTELGRSWDSRGHFFAAAAEAMRRILIDAARKKQTLRRGGAGCRRELLEGDVIATPVDDDLIDLDEAITALATVDAQAVELVKLRVFAGATIDEAAQYLGISPRTAKRSWAYARAWLGRRLGNKSPRK